MRVLMWLSVGFAAACALGAYILPQSILLHAAIAVLAASLIALLAARWLRPAYIPFLLLLGCSLGLGWFGRYQTTYIAPAAAWDGTTLDVTVIASDYSYETDYGSAVEGKIHIDGREYSLRVYFEDTVTLEPGDSVRGTFRFRYTAPKEGEMISHFQGKGIFLLANQKGELETVKAEELSWQYYPAILAQKIKGLLKAAFPEDVYPFVKALLLGDSSELSYEVDTDFKISGIRHIIAVSGLHVSILYSLIAALTGRRRFLTALLGIPVLVLFAAVAGFTPSVSRACVMVGLMMLAELFQKEYDSPTALSFACLVMLIVNPMTISSVSFQLSVGCVAGILLFQSPIQSWLNGRLYNEKKGRSKLKSWFAGSVAVTLSAMTLTTPLSAFYFGTVSIVGVLTNLLTLWVVNLIFNGIIVICILSFLSMNLAVLLGAVLAWPIRYVLAVAHILSRAPLAALYTGSVYIVAWLVFCYVLLAVFLLSRNRRPLILFCCACLGLCLCLGLSWAEPLLDECRATVLDVGQGQAILLQSEGKTFLVDCGGDSDTQTADIIAHKLFSQGIRQLDGIILTHCDADHAGGLSYLLSRVETDLILLPATEADFAFPETDARVIWVDRELSLSFGSGEIRIYPPVFTTDSNENSLCILFDTENCDILITGDRSGKGERMLLKQFALPKVDLLVAGHHGSGNSTSEELLRAVQPETVIISVGKGNIYGHPAADLLSRLAEFGCAVYRTDQNGTIIYRR